MKKMLLIAALLALAGCATYKSTMTDAQGRTMTCEASGKNGLITGVYLRHAYEACMEDAHAKGFN